MIEERIASHDLPLEGEVVVGRGKDAGVRVDHPSVSRAHVAIELGARVRVRDLGSANGTTLRGARLPSGTAVEIGANEAIGLGDVTVVVQERRPRASGAAPAPA